MKKSKILKIGKILTFQIFQKKYFFRLLSLNMFFQAQNLLFFRFPGSKIDFEHSGLTYRRFLDARSQISPKVENVMKAMGSLSLRTADISKIHIKSAKMVTKNLSPEMKRSRSKESQKNGEKNLKPPESFQIFIFVFSGFQNN